MYKKSEKTYFEEDREGKRRVQGVWCTVCVVAAVRRYGRFEGEDVSERQEHTNAGLIATQVKMCWMPGILVWVLSR